LAGSPRSRLSPLTAHCKRITKPSLATISRRLSAPPLSRRALSRSGHASVSKRKPAKLRRRFALGYARPVKLALYSATEARGNMRGRPPDASIQNDAMNGLMHCNKRGVSVGYSITSSARMSDAGGKVMPSVLAVLRLRTRSNFVGCSIGRNLGMSQECPKPAVSRCSNMLCAEGRAVRSSRALVPAASAAPRAERFGALTLRTPIIRALVRPPNPSACRRDRRNGAHDPRRGFSAFDFEQPPGRLRGTVVLLQHSQDF
jgi:hypothetical protein